jgi:cysteinyl-tRNA synthetase
MSLNLYDTFSNSKKKFEPIDPKNIRMYVCGPTVYDYPHVGNARPVIVFDILFRILQNIYGTEHVTYVRNITDVDDKIINASQENNEDINELTSRTINYFHADAKYIGAMEPSFEPRATDHIAEMINIIETLIEKNYAYVAENNVLFSSNKFSKYGSLSGKKLEEMIAGSRVDVESYKQEASDFILWKPSKDNEPGWDSPWGKGRPGWHIECSAMSEKLLGKTFDIHGGGQDLIFPHHENEIAQSECANEEKFANYWVHNGFVTVEGNKMAKSDGNFVTVNELKEKYQGEVIRLTMILTHYRQPLNWTNDNLQESKKTLDKWYQYFSEVDFKPGLNVKIDENVMNALNDDMNTPQAIAELHKLFKNCKSNDHDSLNQFLISAQFLGLMNDEPSQWLSWGKENISVDQNNIESLIAQRNTARANKDFAEADRIRDELENLGIVLEDKGTETTWKTK